MPQNYKYYILHPQCSLECFVVFLRASQCSLVFLRVFLSISQCSLAFLSVPQCSLLFLRVPQHSLEHSLVFLSIVYCSLALLTVSQRNLVFLKAVTLHSLVFLSNLKGIKCFIKVLKISKYCEIVSKAFACSQGKAFQPCCHGCKDTLCDEICYENIYGYDYCPSVQLADRILHICHKKGKDYSRVSDLSWTFKVRNFFHKPPFFDQKKRYLCSF